ncbi:MAG: endonuclease III, partial [Acidobacteria bacterium]|nr:endonuclease III [Acidobacteriota bacterium]
MATKSAKPATALAKKPSALKKAAVKKGTPKRNTYNPLAPERITAILDALRKAYPNAVCALHHNSAWELVVATALSAQCTDVRVNMVTPELFRTFPTPKALAEAPLPAIEEIIRTTGFFRAKAKNIQGAAKAVVEKFGNKV